MDEKSRLNTKTTWPQHADSRMTSETLIFERFKEHTEKFSCEQDENITMTASSNVAEFYPMEALRKHHRRRKSAARQQHGCPLLAFRQTMHIPDHVAPKNWQYSF